MRGPRPVACNFPNEFVQDAMETVRRRTALVQDVQRFRLVLLLHEKPTISNDEAAEKVGLSARQVQRWRRRWATGDFSIEDYAGRGKKPKFFPRGARGRRCHGLRSRGRNRVTNQSAIGGGSDEAGAKGLGQADQQQHGVADVARGRDQAMAV